MGFFFQFSCVLFFVIYISRLASFIVYSSATRDHDKMMDLVLAFYFSFKGACSSMTCLTNIS